MALNDGHGSEGHPLEDLVFEKIYDSEGGVKTTIGGHEEGSISRAGEIGARQADAASSPEDLEGYNLRREDGDWPIVVEKAEELIAQGLSDGRLTEQEVSDIRTKHRVCNETFDELRAAMLAEQADAPRVREIGRLRELLAEEDAQSGGRSTGRREQIVQRIAALHGGR